jgi:hypothetical protein
MLSKTYTPLFTGGTWRALVFVDVLDWSELKKWEGWMLFYV